MMKLKNRFRRKVYLSETFKIKYKDNGRVFNEVVEKTIRLDEMQVEEAILQETRIFIEMLSKIHSIPDEQIFCNVIAALELRGNNPIEGEFDKKEESQKSDKEDKKDFVVKGFTV